MRTRVTDSQFGDSHPSSFTLSIPFRKQLKSSAAIGLPGMKSYPSLDDLPNIRYSPNRHCVGKNGDGTRIVFSPEFSGMNGRKMIVKYLKNAKLGKDKFVNDNECDPAAGFDELEERATTEIRNMHHENPWLLAIIVDEKGDALKGSYKAKNDKVRTRIFRMESCGDTFKDDLEHRQKFRRPLQSEGK